MTRTQAQQDRQRYRDPITGEYADMPRGADPAGQHAIAAAPTPPWGAGVAVTYSGSGTQGRVLSREEILTKATSEGAGDVTDPDAFAAYINRIGVSPVNEVLLTDPEMDESAGWVDGEASGSIDPRDWDSRANGYFTVPDFTVDKATGSTSISARQYTTYDQRDIELNASEWIYSGTAPWRSDDEFHGEFRVFMEETYGMQAIEGGDEDHPIAGAWEMQAHADAPPTASRAIDAWQQRHRALDKAVNDSTMRYAFDEWAAKRYGSFTRPRSTQHVS